MALSGGGEEGVRGAARDPPRRHRRAEERGLRPPEHPRAPSPPTPYPRCGIRCSPSLRQVSGKRRRSRRRGSGGRRRRGEVGKEPVPSAGGAGLAQPGPARGHGQVRARAAPGAETRAGGSRGPAARRRLAAGLRGPGRQGRAGPGRAAPSAPGERGSGAEAGAWPAGGGRRAASPALRDSAGERQAGGAAALAGDEQVGPGAEGSVPGRRSEGHGDAGDGGGSTGGLEGGDSRWFPGNYTCKLDSIKGSPPSGGGGRVPREGPGFSQLSLPESRRGRRRGSPT